MAEGSMTGKERSELARAAGLAQALAHVGPTGAVRELGEEISGLICNVIGVEPAPLPDVIAHLRERQLKEPH